MIDYCRELDDGVATEDGIVRVGNVYHVEGYQLRPLGVPFTEGHAQFDFSEGLNFFPTEANVELISFGFHLKPTPTCLGKKAILLLLLLLLSETSRAIQCE